jgi:membrane protein implicated in regulation of membrane protease activity
MAALEALYLQDPYWLWLGAGCLLVALSLATGLSLLMWPALAAAAVAGLEASGLRAGPAGEAAIFVVLSLAALGVLILRVHQADAAEPAESPRRPAVRAVSGRQNQTGRLVGRIGRASGEFVNGVGRVWIEGAEWGADLESSEETLPDGAPVRVIGVTGGIRLRVQPLSTG